MSNPKGIEKLKELAKLDTEIERQETAREELENIEIQKTQLAREIVMEERERLKILTGKQEDLEKIELAREITRERLEKLDI